MNRLLATAVFCLPLLPVASQGVHMGIPPEATRCRGGFARLRPSANLEGRLRLDCAGKFVELTWVYSVDGDFHDLDGPDAYEEQEFAVSFWPTSAEVVDSTTLLVAGKERDGDTRIERWKVRSPDVVQPAAGGEYSLTMHRIADIEVIYDGAVDGRDMVRVMFRARGKPSSVFVQFYDSRDLYEINWGVAPFALTSVLTANAEPALAASYDSFPAGDHATRGYVYVWADDEGFFSVPALVLTDFDRDGIIDTHETLSWHAYHAAGLTDATAFIEVNGDVR